MESWAHSRKMQGHAGAWGWAKIDMGTYYQNEILTRSGERRLNAWSNSFLHDSQGNSSGVAGIGVDITERKPAKEYLRKSEEKYRILTENRIDVFFGTIFLIASLARIYQEYHKVTQSTTQSFTTQTL